MVVKDLDSALPISIPTLARALDRSPDCVKLLDLDGRLLWMNANGQCAMEIDDFRRIKGRKWTDLWPEAVGETVGNSLVSALDKGVANFSGFCPTAKGTPRWWDVVVHTAEDDSGNPVGYISVSRDVTEREQHLASLEAVVSEMRHRLRNSYTIVCGLIRGLARGNPEAADFSNELLRRIAAIADAQSLLATGANQAGLADLVQTLIAPFQNSEGVDVTVDADPSVVIDARVGDAVALAVGELVVNSAKHGALAKGGRIDVQGRVAGEALTLVWKESADEPVTATAREGGQGLKIITQMLRANNAELDLQWDTHGPVMTITFRKGFSRLAGRNG